LISADCSAVCRQLGARSLELTMKIASFNINDINRRLTNLLNWLSEAEPDIVCLQELKSTDAEFPAEAIRGAAYQAVWRGEKRWNRVAILARWAPQATLTTGNPATSKRPSMACLSPRSMRRMETLSLGLNSITSSPG
jgi:exonuclease III